MVQGEDELEADPFTCGAMAMGAGSAAGPGEALSLADVDARLGGFAAEHTWDAHGLLCDFGCAARA